MRNSLEIAVEKFFIAVLRSDPRLTGKQFFHFDQESKAKSNAIIVQAKIGGRNLAAIGGYDLEAMIEYRSPALTKKEQNDLVVAAINEVIQGTPQATLQLMKTEAGLSDIVIKDESSSDRQNTADLRKRMITFPVQAKLA